MFLKDIKSHGNALLMRRYLADVDESKADLTVPLKEVIEEDCSFGPALGYAMPQSVCCS